jgi:transcriptional regulator with XRE-family HTH domain
MAFGEDEAGMRIGEVLKSARTRQGLDIRTVEEQTKIRIKYLRALEAEEWDVLPNPAYATGFLRTYAQLLGLDGEALVDEYRREAETDYGLPLSPVGERVLERGRRLGDGGGGGPSWGLLAAIAAVIVVAVFLVLGLTGGDDDGGDGGGKREARAQERREERRREQRQRERQREQEAAQNERVTLKLEVLSNVTVCLLGEGDRPLIDGQVLFADSEEGPYEAQRFELRFPFGYDRSQFRLLLNGETTRLPETSGPAAFVITPPDRVRPGPEPGPECA